MRQPNRHIRLLISVHSNKWFICTHFADNLLLPVWYQTGSSISDATMHLVLVNYRVT